MGSRATTTEEAMRETMAGVYYRHEFARRNEHIVKASQKLLSLLPTTAKMCEKLSTYLHPPDETLTTYLEKEIQSTHGNKLKVMKSQLLEFLNDYRILPVPPFSKPFFSYSGKIPVKAEKKTPAHGKLSVDFEKIYFEYTGILRFETFAITELGLRHPVFLPVVLMGGTFGRWKKAVESLTHGDNQENHRFRIILINDEVPISTVNDNITALRVSMFMHDANYSKAISKKRNHFGKYDQYIEAYDAINIHGKSAKEVAEAIVKNHTPKEYCGGQISSANAFKVVTNKFSEWQNKGSDLVLNYRRII